MAIDNDIELIKDLDSKYCINVFNPLNIAFVKGKGVYLYDTKGNKYMDMIGGIAVSSLGHRNPALVKTIKDQADKFIHCSNYYLIKERSELAYLLCRYSFGDKCFFANSGAEANEAAIKLARGYFHYKNIDRYEILTAKMSFHGRTLGTIAATGQEKFRIPFEPAAPGFAYAEFNNFEDVASKVNEHTAAIMLELIQGESGVRPADVDFVKNVRKLCNEHGILLIVDEVQTGVGRTGTMFCYEQYGIKPDIMSLAKGLAGGVPIGAMVCTDEAATGFRPGDHGSTFGGNPLACAAGVTVIEQIKDKDLLANVNKVSEVIVNGLLGLKKKYPVIKEVRGRGLLIGIEFTPEITASGMRQQLINAGFLTSAIGTSTIRIAPPLIISEAEAMKFVNALGKILKAQKKNPILKSGS